MQNKGKYIVGKISKLKKGKGWFFGHFMDNKLLKSSLVEVAWQDISNKKSNPKDKHHHKESIEINIVISGAVKAVVNGEKISVQKGDFYIIYPHAVIEKVSAIENTHLIVVRIPSLADDKECS